MDIRIDTRFFSHPKTMKLISRMGADGVCSLLRLWLWSAENRPSGFLHGLNDEDIDLIAGGGQIRPDQTSSSSFTQLAKELGWIDTGEDGGLYLHEWAQYNPWVSDAPSRSDKARFSKLASVAPAAYFKLVEEGRNSITAEEYRAVVNQMNDSPAKRKRAAYIAPAPSPSPSPAPALDMNQLLRVYRDFPGYRAELEYKERIWLGELEKRFSELDITEELKKAKSWIELKQDFQVKNSRAYIIKWLERVQKERS